MPDDTLQELQNRVIEPDPDPNLPPSEENTKRYFEILKRFVEDAKNAKESGIPGAGLFWEKLHLDVVAEAIESAEKVASPFEKAALIGRLIGQAAIDCKPDVDRFLAERSATAAGASGGAGHSNLDYGAASVSGLLGSGPSQALDSLTLKLSNTVDDIPRALLSQYLKFKFMLRQHDYAGCAEEALNYFARVKGYYDKFSN